MKTFNRCRFVLLLFVIFIPFLIHNIEKLDYDHQSSRTTAVVTNYLCPQKPITSRGYFRVDFTNDLKVNYTETCELSDILLVYILSKIDHIDRREQIRRTWANQNDHEQLVRTCFIFLVGRTQNSSLNSQIELESSAYADLVQLNINETDQSIVYKEVGGLKWSSIYASHIPYLFKTNDDMIIDSLLLSDMARYFQENRTDYSNYLRTRANIQEFIQEMVLVDKYTLFKGIYIEGDKTMREGKFGLSYVAWNDDKLPGYCRGSGYMFSSFVRDRLYRASLCYALDYVPWIGDLFVSGFLATAGAVRCSNWSMEYIQPLNDCAASFQTRPRLLVCSTPMYMGRIDREDYDRAWKVIYDRHSATDETIEEEKEDEIALLKKQSKENLLVKESIIEQMEAKQMQQREAIVLLN